MTNPIDAHVAEALRKRRLALNLSLDDVALVSGVSPEQIGQIESGQHANAGQLGHLVQTLGTTIEALLPGGDGAAWELPPSIVDAEALQGTKAHLVAALDTAAPAGNPILLRLIEIAIKQADDSYPTASTPR